MNPISSRISWIYQKNKHILDSLIFHNAPEFVYDRNPSEIRGEIPVFTYHTALPDTFERNCQYLVENGYKTLSAEEFLYYLSTPHPKTKKQIVLTFDDGLKHVWTVVFPLLKKYGLKAICFLIPGCISEADTRIRPTLEDYWEGNASLSEIMDIVNDPSALATWPEIKMMHESGVVDFQSHTMYHGLVFTSDSIFDFMNPEYDKHFYGNIHIPIYSKNGKDINARDIALGMPIYYSKPRMSADSRYFDDENIRMKCVEYVNMNGKKNFFTQSDWRKILSRVVSDHQKNNEVSERFEKKNERDTAIFNEMYNSRKIIEEKLTGKKVDHLCYPWYEAGDFAVRISKKAGYRVNYFGTVSGRPTNRIGSDPYKITRVEDMFLERLPGLNRCKVKDIIRNKFKNREVPKLFGIKDS